MKVNNRIIVKYLSFDWVYILFKMFSDILVIIYDIIPLLSIVIHNYGGNIKNKMNSINNFNTYVCY